jgi:peptidoglycan/LPS O-acetylase OafA/YrhL
MQVVFYHRLPLGNAPQFARDLNSFGYQAVTFFFVLSGFILTYVYIGRSGQDGISTSKYDFWKARAARIMPAYFFALILAIPSWIEALQDSTITFHNFVLGLVLAPTFQQAWWPPSALAMNSPAWSLSVEFFFYALFPYLTFKSVRLSRDYIGFLAFALVFVVTVAILRHVISSPDAPVDSLLWGFDRYFPPFHVPQFIFGIALGLFFIFGPKISSKNHTIMFCVGTVALLLVFASRSHLPWWMYSDATLVPLFSLIIFGGSRAGRVLSVLTWPSLTFLGEVSYSIYILHAPIAWWWDQSLWQIGYFVNGDRYFLWQIRHFVYGNFLGYSVFVVAVSILFHVYVDTPTRRWILGHREHRAT